MEDGIGCARHALGPDLAGRWPEQRQELGGAVSDIFMRLARRISLCFPALSGRRNGLIGSCLILIAQDNASGFRFPVGPLDHPLICSVSGSTTVTTPALRTRWAVPVGHQLLVF